MPAPEVFSANELARIMGNTVQGIRSALHSGQEGITIPPSIKLGRRRRWLREVVYAWLRERAQMPRQQGGPDSNPSSTQESESMPANLPTIFTGQMYAADDGTEFTIVDFDVKTGRVVVETTDGRQGVMTLDDVLSAIRNGDLVDVPGEIRYPDGAEPI